MSSKLSSILALLAILATKGIFAQSTTAEGPPVANVQTAKNDDLSVMLSLKKKSTPTNALLIVTVTTLINEPMVTMSKGGIVDCKVVLRDENGVACPYTNYGWSIFVAGIGYSSFWVTIAGTREFEIPLEKLFKLQPGTWTLDFDIGFDIGSRSKPTGRGSKVQIKGFKIPIEAPAK
jgi:hypothetical protein